MKGLMKEIFKTCFNLQSQLLYWNSIHKQSKWKASWRNSLCLDSTFKASYYSEILFTQKNSLNEQGQNSFHNQSKWKATWRNSLWLDSTFKASCFIAIPFTKKTGWIDKAKILSTKVQMKGLMKELFMTWSNLQN